MNMERERYFKCKKCKHLIRYHRWSIELERQHARGMVWCPQCQKPKTLTGMQKRPYYRKKLECYLSIVVMRDGHQVTVSK